MQIQIEKFLLGLGAAAVICLGLLITANVAARALFGTNVPDTITIVQELMVAAILLPLAAATAARAHVCVAFVSDRFGARTRSWLVVMGSLFGMIALAPLVYAGVHELIDVWSRGSFYYGDLSLPKWPGRLLFVVGVGACFLRLAELFWRDLGTLRAGGIVDDSQNEDIFLKEAQ